MLLPLRDDEHRASMQCRSRGLQLAQNVCRGLHLAQNSRRGPMSRDGADDEGYISPKTVMRKKMAQSDLPDFGLRCYFSTNSFAL